MTNSNPVAEGFRAESAVATARSQALANGSLTAEVADADTDAERLGRLGDLDGLAAARVAGTSSLADVSYLQEALEVVRSVVCVRRMDKLGREVGSATGVMVSPRLLLTTHHALPTAEDAVFSTVWFEYQKDDLGALAPKLFRFEPYEFFVTSPELDYTLVAVEEEGPDDEMVAGFGYALLSEESPLFARTERLTVVEHPGGGFKQVGFRAHKVLATLGEHLHVSPDHDAASPGAPFFNDEWELVGINHAAVHGVSDERNGGECLANELVRASAICADLKSRPWDDEETEFIEELLAHEWFDDEEGDYDVLEAEPEPEPDATPEVTADEPAEPEVEAEAHQPREKQEATGDDPVQPPALPLHHDDQDLPDTPPPLAPALAGGAALAGLDWQLGEAELPPELPDEGAPAEPAAPVGASLDGFPEASYVPLTGFDERFLGPRTPLPRMLPVLKQQVARSKQGVEVLDYTHFSAVVNGRRKLAFFTAANIDTPAKTQPGVASPGWMYDPRVDQAFQVGPELLEGDDLTHAHLVPSTGNSWGAEADRAYADTFHFTNFCPAPVGLESDPVWNGIEAAMALHPTNPSHRVSVYYGPVFGPSDPLFRGVQIPVEVWKVVVIGREDGELLAVALRHGPLPNGEGAAGEYATTQVRVGDIEHLTGLDFGSLRDRDPFAPTEGSDRGRVVRRLADLSV